jgi:hypothetical protein
LSLLDRASTGGFLAGPGSDADPLTQLKPHQAGGFSAHCNFNLVRSKVIFVRETVVGKRERR